MIALLMLIIGMIINTGFASIPKETKKQNRYTKLFEEADKAFDSMYDIDWNIEFYGKKKTRLAFMYEVEIIRSVDNLADVATIILPEAIMNEVINLEGKINRGDAVIIEMGYDGDLVNEFTGHVREITTNNSLLKIHCEDALFKFRVGVKDKELKPTSIKKIAQYLIDEIDKDYKIDCDYDISYEKFTIHDATAFDVLKKLQEESSANIYFETTTKTLHIHPPYTQKGGEVHYSMQKNVETSSLKYDNKEDKKVEVIIESTDTKGNIKKVTAGTTGGDKVTMKVGSMPDSSMQEIANEVLKRHNSPGYNGTFDTWLIPKVEPSYTARIKDEDYPDKTGRYYVSAVTTKLSSSGGVRTITPKIKLS